MDIKSIKVKLKSILHHNLDYTFLFDIIKRGNDLIFTTSHFIRLFLLQKYSENNINYEFDIDFFLTAFRVLIKNESKKGPKQKRNLILREEMENFYNTHFQEILPSKFDGTNLSYIYSTASEQMVISFRNNIQINYTKYLCQYVNKLYCIPKEYSPEHKKQMKKELNQVKKDLIEGTLNSYPKYHNWINEHKQSILPNNIVSSVLDDLYTEPYKFFICMLKMNQILEDNNCKTFQPICLRSSVNDKFITINSRTLIDILPNFKNVLPFLESKNDSLLPYLDDIWSNVFNLEKIKRINTGKNLKYKNCFNHEIKTDGTSVCLSIIASKDKIKNIDKKKLRAEKSIERKKENKSLSREEIEANEKMRKEKQKEIQRAKRKEQLLLNKVKPRPKIANESYIETLVKSLTTLHYLKEMKSNNKFVFCDPGKKSILTISGDNGKNFSYNCRRRLKETKRLKYIKLIDNYKKKQVIETKSIKELESQLSNFSSKTMNPIKFAEFTKLKLDLRNKIKNTNYNTYLNKLSWFGHINKCRHEDKIINELKNIYPTDSLIIMGDWSMNGKLKHISTPNIRIQRILGKHYKVVKIDEYNTSKISHKTQEKMEDNLYVKFISKKKKKVVEKSLHSVLTYKMGNNRIGCINRDKNAVENMRIITNSLLENKTRPKVYCRNHNNKTSEPLKVVKSEEAL